MPLYDYQCDDCGATFEALSSISDRDEMSCECGAKATRLLSGGHFMLMGGGWTAPGHGKIIPPDESTNPKAPKDGWHTNYYNCTPESVHRT